MENTTSRYLELIASHPAGGIIITDSDGKTTWVNKEVELLTGYPAEELLGHKPGQLLQDIETDPDSIELMRTAIRDRKPFETTLVNYTKSGLRYWVRLRCDPFFHPDGSLDGFIGTLVDITAIRRLSDFNSLHAEVNKVIARNEEDMPLLQAVCDLAVTHAHLELAWIGRPDKFNQFEFVAKSGNALPYLENFMISIDPNIPEGQGPSGMAWRDGTPHYSQSFQTNHALKPWQQRARRYGLDASATMPIFRNGKIWAVMSVYHARSQIFDEELRKVLDALAEDISNGLDRIDLRNRERVLSNQLYEREKGQRLFRALLDQATDAIQIIDPETQRFIDLNARACLDLGYTREELLTMTPADIDPEFAANPGKFLEPLQKSGECHVETVHRRKDGSIFPVELVIKNVVLDKAYGLTIARDITERKRSELDLKHNASQLETIFSTQKDPILLYDLDMNVSRCTPHIKDEYGFDPVGMNISEIARRVMLRGIDDSLVILDGRTPTAVAVTGKEVLKAVYKLTRADGSTAVVEVTSTPFYVDDEIHGAITTWHDITELKRASEEIAKYARQLENSMQQTLLAVSKMVDQRDPYTAGHERRVGQIAAAIAQEMGWSERKCQELEMIGLVHDIGKISIPAEILSKPARLSDLEYEIVKTHVENGYEILRHVDFPLPIADIIRQHHERMNGSGYPQGLQGEQILVEARILAVADVLESMSSHRPYRPALGVGAALDELTGKRELYDPAVVDAVIALIRDKGYKLPA